MGLSISMSTLQDTTKTQNKASQKVWEDPQKGKLFLIIMSLTTLFFIIMGMVGMFFTDKKALNDLSIGLFVMGIGMIGLIKAASEMFENHRKDKNPV